MLKNPLCRQIASLVGQLDRLDQIWPLILRTVDLCRHGVVPDRPTSLGFSKAVCRSSCLGSESSQRSMSPFSSTTGIRSCIAAVSGDAADVTIEKLSIGYSLSFSAASSFGDHRSQTAATLSGAPSERSNRHGCLEPGAPVHSYHPQTGTIARRFRIASRYAGLLAIVCSDP